MGWSYISWQLIKSHYSPICTPLSRVYKHLPIYSVSFLPYRPHSLSLSLSIYIYIYIYMYLSFGYFTQKYRYQFINFFECFYLPHNAEVGAFMYVCRVCRCVVTIRITDKQKVHGKGFFYIDLTFSSIHTTWRWSQRSFLTKQNEIERKLFWLHKW